MLLIPARAALPNLHHNLLLSLRSLTQAAPAQQVLTQVLLCLRILVMRPSPQFKGTLGTNPGI